MIKFAIALVNINLVILGHCWLLLVKLMSKLTYCFHKHCGHIKCEVTVVKKYLKDLRHGGFEIPARLTISNANKRMLDVMTGKLNTLIEKYRKIKSKPK